MGVLLFQLYLWILSLLFDLFFSLLTLPGALAAVISMFCSKRLWKRGMGWKEREREMEWEKEWKQGNR